MTISISVVSKIQYAEASAYLYNAHWLLDLPSRWANSDHHHDDIFDIDLESVQTMKKSRIWFIGALIVVGCGMVFWLSHIYRTHVLHTYKMPSGSMMPTLLVGDYFYADMSTKNLDDIKRGDIIVFTSPKNPALEYVKRVIGLPGDTIEIRDKVLYINGKLKNESYVMHKDYRIYPAQTLPRDNTGPLIIPQGHLFVLGDNRDASNDSRFWGFVAADKIRGKAINIYWSWDRDNIQVRWKRIGKGIH